MSVTYIRYYPEYTRHYEEIYSNKKITIFDPVMERFETDLFDRCRNLDPSYREVDYFILRGRTKDFDRIIKNQPKDAFKKIFPCKNLVKLVGSTALFAQPSLSNIFKDAKPRLKLDLLREAEILTVLNRGQCIYSPNPNEGYHFKLPSGLHSNKFIRIADGLQDPVEITRLADWIIPHISENTVIISDTGSITALMFALKSEVSRLFDINVGLRTLDEYPPSLDTFSNIIRDSKAKAIKSEGKLLFIVSVNSSGKYLNLLTKVIAKEGGSQIIVICDTEFNKKLSYERLLHYPITKYDVVKDKCSLCEDSNILPINPRSYQISPDLKRKRVVLNFSFAGNNKKFWSCVKETDSLELNVTKQYYESNSSRKYSFYINIKKLCQSNWFVKKAKDNIETLNAPDLVLIAKHENSSLVQELVSNKFPNAEYVITSPSKFNKDIIEKIRNLNDSPNILIADDALVTNKTIQNFRYAIYAITSKLNIRPKFQIFVLLSRPSSSRLIIDAINPFREEGVEHDILNYGCEVFLPGPNDSTWDEESNFLRETLSKVPSSLKSYVNSRLQEINNSNLSNVILGLNEEIIKESITVGSFFGDLSIKVGFAAAVSACCKLKNDKFSEFQPWQTQVDVINSARLINCYFESCFLAAALRYFPQKYFIGEKYADDVIDEIQKLDSNNICPGIIEELAWAAVNRKLAKEPILELVNSVSNKSKCLEYLKYLLEFDDLENS